MTPTVNVAATDPRGNAPSCVMLTARSTETCVSGVETVAVFGCSMPPPLTVAATEIEPVAVVATTAPKTVQR